MNIIKNIETARIKSPGKGDVRSHALLKLIIFIAVFLTVVSGAYPIISTVFSNVSNSKHLVIVLSTVLTGGVAFFASISVSRKFDNQPVMDVANLSIISGIISFCVLLYFIAFKQKNIDRNDIGGLAAIYTAGANLPKAIFLTFYGIIPEYKKELATTHLTGYENYITLSGLILLGLCAVTYWAVLKPFFKKKE